MKNNKTKNNNNKNKNKEKENNDIPEKHASFRGTPFSESFQMFVHRPLEDVSLLGIERGDTFCVNAKAFVPP